MSGSLRATAISSTCHPNAPPSSLPPYQTALSLSCPAHPKDRNPYSAPPMPDSHTSLLTGLDFKPFPFVLEFPPHLPIDLYISSGHLVVVLLSVHLPSPAPGPVLTGPMSESFLQVLPSEEPALFPACLSLTLVFFLVLLCFQWESCQSTA